MIKNLDTGKWEQMDAVNMLSQNAQKSRPQQPKRTIFQFIRRKSRWKYGGAAPEAEVPVRAASTAQASRTPHGVSAEHSNVVVTESAATDSAQECGSDVPGGSSHGTIDASILELGSALTDLLDTALITQHGSEEVESDSNPGNEAEVASPFAEVIQKKEQQMRTHMQTEDKLFLQDFHRQVHLQDERLKQAQQLLDCGSINTEEFQKIKLSIRQSSKDHLRHDDDGSSIAMVGRMAVDNHSLMDV